MEQYSLTELCAVIGDSIAVELPDTYWVRAEIASMSVRGHCYMELVEKATDGILAAKIRATCWSHRYTLLAAYFAQTTGESLRVGMQVLVEVSIQFHAVFGLSLNIENIDPNYTIGDLAQQRQRTLQRLKEDGVMELQQTLTLPTLPRRIAVISSPDAAGYGDFCDQLMHNSIGFRFRTHLFPALMQGENAAVSMIAALTAIARESEQWDVVVLIRGGGATTDLSCFDDYMLATHCAQFPLPIVAGIGHTRDVSVVDQVVYSSVKTPTAAAQWLIGLVEEQADRIERLQYRWQNALRQTVLREQNRLQHQEQNLRYGVQRLIMREQNRLVLWEKTVAMHSPERIYNMGYSLMTVNGKVVRSVQEVQDGQVVTTCLKDGIVRSVVQQHEKQGAR